MPLVPLLPLFHRFNREYFDSALALGSKPILSLRWSDGRLRKTAGFYRKIRNILGQSRSEIVLSRPLLEKLPLSAIESTLCHEMIHAWIDLVLHLDEVHGPNFVKRMSYINAAQSSFQISVRHEFPVPITMPKWQAICPTCGGHFPYKRRVRGAACKVCCDLHHGGRWDSSCLFIYEPIEGLVK